MSSKFPTPQHMRLQSDPFTSDAEVRVEASRCLMHFHNYASGIVTKLVVADGKALLQKFNSVEGTDTFIGEVTLGEVK